MASFPDDIAETLRRVDWSQYDCAITEASHVPAMWDRFMRTGDRDWEFGNELCHQGTLYSAIFPLIEPLLTVALAEHPSRPDAITILASVLRSSDGRLSYRKRLAELRIPIPFAPGKLIPVPQSPKERDLQREAEQIREAQLAIEAHLSAWLALADTKDADLRFAALDLLTAVKHHENSPQAAEAVRRAYDAGNSEERERMAWLIDELESRRP